MKRLSSFELNAMSKKSECYDTVDVESTSITASNAGNCVRCCLEDREERTIVFSDKIFL